MEKHPSGKPFLPDFLLSDAQTQDNCIIFKDLDAEAILKLALETNGAAGRSGLDAYAWLAKTL